jgi:glyoxylase-like metal-dependent hydrolase (beta-lactamase superfamily II)
MKISDHVAMLKIVDESDARWTFRPVLLFDKDELILVDTGYLYQYEQLKSEMESNGFSVSSLTGLILTHQDGDHMAVAGTLRNDAPCLRVMAHVVEAPHIDGTKTPLKLAAMGTDTGSFSEEEMWWYRIRKECAEKGATNVDIKLSGGDFLPFCGGIDVIHTPGHTPGHISLFVREDGILIPGDAMHFRDGEMYGPMIKPTPDVVQATKSIEQFRNYPIKKVACFHGGLFEGDFAAALDEILAGKLSPV